MSQACVNVAVRDLGPFITMLIDDLLLVTSPDQPVKTRWLAGLAHARARRPAGFDPAPDTLPLPTRLRVRSVARGYGAGVHCPQPSLEKPAS